MAPDFSSPPTPAPAPHPHPHLLQVPRKPLRTPRHKLLPPLHAPGRETRGRRSHASPRTHTPPATESRATPAAVAPDCKSPPHPPPLPDPRRISSTANEPSTPDRNGSSAPSSRRTAAAASTATHAA